MRSDKNIKVITASSGILEKLHSEEKFYFKR